MQRGRSSSPSTRMARGRSSSPSARLGRGRSSSPSMRIARPKSTERLPGTNGAPGRGRSRSPSRMIGRSRSSSPSQMIGMSKAASSAAPGGGGGGDSSRPKRPRNRIRASIHKIKKPIKRLRRPRNRGEGGASQPPPLGPDGQPRKRKNLRRSLRKGASIKRLKKRVPKRIRKIAKPKEACTWCKLCQYIIPILLIFTSAIGMVVSTGNVDKLAPEKLKNLIPKLDKGNIKDPNSGTDVARWDNGNNNQGGLELEFLNALDDSWQVIYALAIADWDFGSPDSLTLSSEQISYDYDCKQEDGKVKVCNGDYGETNWRGINEALLDAGGFIVASSARMNEFYLQNDGKDAMQYTMCHEIGHALGLPHSDESFDNEDLGNCMDYTDNFDVNKHPDSTLYEALKDLYGEVGSNRKRNLRKNTDGKVRTSGKIPKPILNKQRHYVQRLERDMEGAVRQDGWRVLHMSRRGSEHEMEIGEGYTLRVQMLRVD